jgi:hypothetical protein
MSVTTAILAFLMNASVFSINGIGEDLSAFHEHFLDREDIAQLGFTLNPEYTLLNQSGDFRGVFWTNPLKLSLSVPVTRGFAVMLGNLERFNQCFDVYLQDSSLQIHVLGEGGIEEAYAGVSKSLGAFDLVATGSYLFGNAWEIWTHSIGGYNLVDTFSYRHRGRIFSFGLKHDLFSVAYEGFGSVTTIKLGQDTLVIDLPERLSIGFYPRIAQWPLGIVYEHSFWSDETYSSPNRFKIQANRKAIAIAYYFNPWYFRDITEHGIDLDLALPLHNVGSVQVRMTLALRQRGDLREFALRPSLTFVLNELFTRRRK